MSQAANGAIVIGATPTPTETSDTARLRCFSNQPVTAAISGGEEAAATDPDQHAIRELEFEESVGPARQRQPRSPG